MLSVVLLLVLLPCESASGVRSRLHVIGDKAREEAVFLPGVGIPTQAARLAEPASPTVGPLGIHRNGAKGFRGAMANQVALPRSAAARSSAASVRMQLPRERRSEGIKAGAVAALSGSVASALFTLSALISCKKTFTLAQWELSTGALAVELFFFGALYRLAIREDNNEQLKQTVVGAFALFRAFSATQLGSKITSDTALQVWAHFGESILAFGSAAYALNYAWKRGIVFPAPPELPPSYDRKFDPFRDYNRGDYPPPPPWY